MLGDHSRDTAPNARRRNYVGVRLKQGTPLLDAAFNEQGEIAHAAVKAVALTALGHWGAPHEESGFAITAGGNGGLTIGAGAFFIQGERVANPAAVGLADQIPGLVLESLAQRLPQFNRTGLAYLEVWHETIDSLDDPRLKEKALGGVEDSLRTCLRWRVDVASLETLQITEAMVRAAKRDCAPLNVPTWQRSTGALAASLADPAAVADLDCELPPEAGYRSQENQLYCVAIHAGGDRANATFKWSREGGGIVGALQRNADGRLVIEGAIDDPRLGFRTGDIVEIIDERSRALGQPGSLRRLMLDPVTGEPSFTPNLTGAQFDALVRPKLVRWDFTSLPPAAPAALPVAQGAPIALENGVQVVFAPGRYQSGDHWLIPARSASGSIEWPPYDPPDQTVGNVPFYASFDAGRLRAPLALVTRRGGQNQTVDIEDVRSIIPALTCLTASDVRVDGGVCQFGPEVVTVQDAIDVLCRARRGLCSVTVAPGDDVQAAFDLINPGEDGTVCFMPGRHDLPDRIIVSSRGRLVVHGAGAMSRLVGQRGAHGLLFKDCGSVTIRDLAVEVGDPVGPFRGGPDAAIECLNCGPVDIESVEVKTGSAGSRRIVGIRVAALANGDKSEGHGVVCEARIARCRVTAGDWQMGIEVLNPSRVIVEDNVVRPRGGSPRFVLDLRLKNRAATRSMIAAMVRRFDPREQDIGARAIVSNNAVRAQFLTHPTLVDVWRRYGEGFAPRSITIPVQLFSHLRHAAEAALRGDGVIRDGDRMFRGFENWFKDVLANSMPTLDGGVVIGGRRIGEARVAGNQIGPAREGISVAASFGTNGPDKSWTQKEPDNTVRRAEIVGNVITVPPRTMQEGSRHGIEVGHFDRQVLIEGNEIDGASGENRGELEDVGILTYGWRGCLLSVTENFVRGFGRGGHFAPPFPPTTTRGIWRIVGNCMTVDEGLIKWGFIVRENHPI